MLRETLFENEMKTSDLKNVESWIRNQRLRLSVRRRDSWMVKQLHLPELTAQELAEVNAAWPWIKVSGRDLIWVRLYKKHHGFNPNFITDYQLQPILKKFNPYKQVVSLQNKAMCDVYFPSIPFPQNYIKCICGELWGAGQHLTIEESVKYLIDQQISEFVIKPSVESGCGKGVRKVKLLDTNDCSGFLKDLFSSYGQNFVVQEVLKQHPQMEKLNPSSVNSCRITTLYFGGVFSYSSILKVGKLGSYVDNWHSSYLVGMNSDGSLKSYGFDNRLNPVTKSDNGVVFQGFVVPCFEKMVAAVKSFHKKYFLNCGIIGWDIIVDSNEEIKVIEINLDSPGVVGEQFCSGTFFEEHKDFINNKFRLNP